MNQPIIKKSIRWKQRFENFQKALKQLENATHQESYSELERAGLIQTFEFTFELAWKTLKDFLESEGIITNSPRQAIQSAFKSHYISDGHTWIDALEKRIFLTHCYNEKASQEAKQLIKDKYFKIMKDFQQKFEQQS